MTDREKSLVKELLELESGLRGREVEFLDDLNKEWWEKDLSDGQTNWLTDIAKRAGLIE